MTGTGARWWTGRAVTLHVALALALPMCGYAAWWQVGRALAGNELSWAYVFEWPAFAGLSVWLWWVLITGPAAPAPAAGPVEPATVGPGAAPGCAARTAAAGRAALLEVRRRPLRWDGVPAPAGLAEYNSWLADLGAGRPAERPAPGRRRPARLRRSGSGA